MEKKLHRFILTALLFTAGCTSAQYVPLATITSKEKTIDIAIDLEKKPRTGFVMMQGAYITPDNRSLVLFAYDFSNAYKPRVKKYTFDAALSTLTVEEVLQPGIPGRYIQGISNERYTVANNVKPRGMQMLLETSVTDKKTGRSALFSGQGTAFFTKHGTLALNLVNTASSGWTQNLAIVKLPELTVLKEFPLPGTLTGELSLFSQSQMQYSMQMMMQSASGGASTGMNGNILVNCASIMVRFIDLRTNTLLGELILIDDSNWLAVAADGRFDGTPEGFSILSWTAGEDRIPFEKFDRSFRKRGLLADIISGRSVSENTTGRVDITDRLIGMVREVNGREIVVSTGRVSGKVLMGDRLFMIIDGEKAELSVTFPMMTVAKCTLTVRSAKYLPKIAKGSPVFR